MPSLEEIESARAERKAKIQEKHNEQKAIDLLAIGDLEAQYGDAHVSFLEVQGYVSGLPVLYACKCPDPAQMKRYRDTIKVKKDGPGDAIHAAEQLATVCRVYPDDETYRKMCAAFPGIHLKLGIRAVKLAEGESESEGKG